MSKAEIKNELEFIDEDIVNTVIECCKQLYCEGIPLWLWDYNSVMEVFDKATKDWEE